MNDTLFELLNELKKGSFQALFIAYTNNKKIFDDIEFTNALRQCVNTIGGMNTRCLIESDNLLKETRELIGKKRDYVKYKIVNHECLNDFINAFTKRNKIILIPSIYTLKEIDNQYFKGKINGTDNVSINEFMRLWHYEPKKNNHYYLLLQRNELLLNEKNLALIDPIFFKKYIKTKREYYGRIEKEY